MKSFFSPILFFSPTLFFPFLSQVVPNQHNVDRICCISPDPQKSFGNCLALYFRVSEVLEPLMSSLPASWATLLTCLHCLGGGTGVFLFVK